MAVLNPPIAWRKLPITLNELCISTVLRCGQSFRWKTSGPDEWSCALNGRILSLRQDPTHLHYRAIFPSDNPRDRDSAVHIKSESEDDNGTAELIRDYFNLSVDLEALYKQWSARDPNFDKKAPKFAGVRMLRQDPWENTISFICSSNNNISRISGMVQNLCLHFGPKLGTLDGEPYHDFPEPAALAVPGIEQKLRDLGFGYRAKYIYNTALSIVNDRPVGWLDGLRAVPYKEAHESLLGLQGIGPKVADCVCLMSLDKAEAVPVDTHVWQIAQRDYKFGKGGGTKTLTKNLYDAIGDYFRELWGKEAGWAHSVLFAADLRTFSEKVVKIEVKTTKTKVGKGATIKGEEVTAVEERKTSKRVKMDDSEIDVEVTLADRVKRRRRHAQ